MLETVYYFYQISNFIYNFNPSSPYLFSVFTVKANTLKKIASTEFTKVTQSLSTQKPSMEEVHNSSGGNSTPKSKGKTRPDYKRGYTLPSSISASVSLENKITTENYSLDKIEEPNELRVRGSGGILRDDSFSTNEEILDLLGGDERGGKIDHDFVMEQQKERLELENRMAEGMNSNAGHGNISIHRSKGY